MSCELRVIQALNNQKRMALILQEQRPAPGTEADGKFLYFMSPVYGQKTKVDAITNALKKEKVFFYIDRILVSKDLKWPKILFTLDPVGPDDDSDAPPGTNDKCSTLKRRLQPDDDDDDDDTIGQTYAKFAAAAA